MGQIFLDFTRVFGNVGEIQGRRPHAEFSIRPWLQWKLAKLHSNYHEIDQLIKLSWTIFHEGLHFLNVIFMFVYHKRMLPFGLVCVVTILCGWRGCFETVFVFEELYWFCWQITWSIIHQEGYMNSRWSYSETITFDSFCYPNRFKLLTRFEAKPVRRWWFGMLYRQLFTAANTFKLIICMYIFLLVSFPNDRSVKKRLLL